MSTLREADGGALGESLDSLVDLETLAAIERRVLWLAVRIVDYANRERPRDDPLKVGGHQASSASMVTLMTALYFAELDADDRVPVKPHASPVLHAIEYLLGHLDRSYLTRLRDFGGLQAYGSARVEPLPGCSEALLRGRRPALSGPGAAQFAHDRQRAVAWTASTRRDPGPSERVAARQPSGGSVRSFMRRAGGCDRVFAETRPVTGGRRWRRASRRTPSRSRYG